MKKAAFGVLVLLFTSGLFAKDSERENYRSPY